jgi:hypothetical protein
MLYRLRSWGALSYGEITARCCANVHKRGTHKLEKIPVHIAPGFAVGVVPLRRAVVFGEEKVRSYGKR